MKYRKDYQERHDIDWFALYEGKPIHVASNGGDIPANIDSKNNRQCQAFLATLELKLKDEEIIINEDWLDELDKRLFKENANINNDKPIYHFDKEMYKQTFIEFAKLGFISIDNAFTDDKYHYQVVAYPRKQENLFKGTNANIPLKLTIVPSEEMANLNLDLW